MAEQVKKNENPTEPKKVEEAPKKAPKKQIKVVKVY